MWPFTRKPPPAPSKGPEPMPVPMMRDDWKFQPPLQRAIGEHPLTAPGDVFAENLATHQDPSVVSRTLGHHVSMNAPAGLILAIATPATRLDGPAMVSRPRVQRRAATASATDLEFPEDPQDTGVSQPAPGLPLRELPIASGPPEVQRLTTIAPGAAPVPIGAGRSVQSGPLEVQRSTPAASDDEVTGPAAAMIDDSQAAVPSRRTLGQSRRLGLGAPLAQVPVTSIQRATEPALASPRREPAASQAAGEATKATTALDEMEPSEPQDHAHGAVSSPMPAEARPAPAIQRALALPLASPVNPHPETSQIEHEAAAPVIDEAAASDIAEAPSETKVQRLELPLRPASAAALATEATAAEARSAHPAAESETMPSEPGSETAGLASRPPAPIQRAVVAGSSDPGNTSPRTVDLPLLQRRVTSGIPASGELITPTPSVVHEASVGMRLAASRPAGESASASTSVATLQAPLAGSRALGTFVQRAPAQGDDRATAATTAVDSGGVHQVVSPLSTVVRLYRSPELGAADTPIAPAEHTPPGTFPAHRNSILQRVGADSPAEPHAIQSSPLTLAQAIQPSLLSPPPAAQSSPLSLPLAPVATMASLQRATASAQAAALLPAIAVQRADAEAAFSGSQETFFAQREVQSASSAGAPSTLGPAAAAEPTASDEAMDALAGKLYDRIRSRLKSELLVDRERAGLLTDLR